MRRFSCLLTLTLLLLIAHRAHGQTMPDGWQTLPADQFAAAAQTFFDAGPSDDVAREVVEHAWQTFLNDETFVTTGDWDTVEQMMNLFIRRRGLLNTGTSLAAREAAQQQLDADLQTLQSRVAPRIDGDPQLVIQSSFEELKTLTSALAWSGVPKSDRAQHYVTWMQNNDWQSLSPGQQVDLLIGIELDQINRLQMSVRWTGTIEAPSTGDYTFEQLRHHGGDSGMKLIVNEQVVLDTLALVGNEDPDNQDYRSQPVTLTAVQPVSIEVQLVHNSADWDDVSGYPMAVLLWESGSVEQQLVPVSAYRPPDGFAEPDDEGLKGEYFSDMNFTPSELVSTRLDPGVQFIWKWTPVMPSHAQQWQQLVDAIWPKLLDNDFLSTLTDDQQRADFVAQAARNLLGWSTVSQRQQFLQTVLSRPDLIGAMQAYHVGKTLEHVYMLPGGPPLQLVSQWATTAEQPKTQLGSMFGFLEGSYQWHNLQFYWLVGHFFEGPRRPQLEQLIEDHLTLASGDCNLLIAYIAAWGMAKEDSTLLIDRLDEALADESLDSNIRVTWLLARAYAASVMTEGQPELLQGMEYMQEALIAATDHDRRFWALQEQVARLGSLGSGPVAEALITQYEGEFNSPEEQATITAWRQQISQLQQEQEQIREEKDLEQRRRQQAEHVAALQRRLEAANARGDTARAAQYSQLIQEFSDEPLE